MLNSTRKLGYLERCLSQLVKSSHQALFHVKIPNLSNTKNELPKNNDHEKTKSIIKPMLELLFNIFDDGSTQNPCVYKSSHDPNFHYAGSLFKFCIEVIPLLEQKGKMKIAMPCTIGDYLIEIKREKNSK